MIFSSHILQRTFCHFSVRRITSISEALYKYFPFSRASLMSDSIIRKEKAPSHRPELQINVEAYNYVRLDNFNHKYSLHPDEIYSPSNYKTIYFTQLYLLF